MNLSPICIEALKSGGWHHERNVFKDLKIPREKKLFPIAEKIIGEFGLLEIEFEGNEPSVPIEKISFDVDESRTSQILRAKMWGYDSPEYVDYEKDPDFSVTEDYELTNIVSRKLEIQCCYLGFHEDYTGFDIFLTENGEIYLTHYQEPIKAANSFEEYLNKVITGKRSKQWWKFW